MKASTFKRVTRSQTSQGRLLETTPSGKSKIAAATSSPKPHPIQPSPGPVTDVNPGQASILHGLDPQPPFGLASSPDRLDRSVVDWLESVGSTQNTPRCRSESRLRVCSNSEDRLPQHASESAPPASLTASFDDSLAREASFDESMRLVELSSYRFKNLCGNMMFLQDGTQELPEHVFEFIQAIRQSQSPRTIERAEVLKDPVLQGFTTGLNETMEEEVTKYFDRKILPAEDPTSYLQRHDKLPIRQELVPNNPLSILKVSTPIPDMIFGYDYWKTYCRIGGNVQPLEEDNGANTRTLLHPFLVIKFKGAQGSMWAVTNQCLGGAASCVALAEKLNDKLWRYETGKQINSSVFSIATNGIEARLFVTWKQDEGYHTALVQAFLLQDYAHHVEFRRWVDNILNWGQNERYREIMEALKLLSDGIREEKSQMAKLRAPPMPDPESLSKRRRLVARKVPGIAPNLLIEEVVTLPVTASTFDLE